MQTKLHRWAGDDAFRRFGDLFNLVYDPAFLMYAWERVSTNTGARTAGIDQATTAWVETRVGVEVFLGQIRQALKSGAFVPVEVRQVMIPKGTTGSSGNWESPPSPTGWSRPASRRYSNLSSRRTLSRARMGFAQTAAHTTRSPRSTTSAPGATRGC